MKKVLIISAVAALALVSCAKVTDQYVGAPESREIGLKAISSPATKTAYNNAVPSTEFPENYSMQVVAYNIPVSGTADEYFGGSTGVTFQKGYAGGAAGSGAYWGGTTAQYWPLMPATLNFFAVTNSNITSGATTSIAFASATAGDDVNETATITLAANQPVAGSTPTYGQHDLMYGKGTATVSNSGNAWTFGTSGNVAITFEHALAWVNFTVNANAAASGKITVNSITLKGASYKGTFTVSHNKFNATTGQSISGGVWSSYTEATTTSVVVPNYTASSPVTTWAESAVNRAANTIGSGLLVVPDGGFTSFVVNYTFDDGTGSSATYDYEYTPASVTLNKGLKYYYDITFKLHEIFVAPTVTDWGDGGSSAVGIVD